MVYIISGKVNQGKTGKIFSIYEQKKAGDGFITKKTVENGIFTGYEITRLSSMEGLPFICKTGNEPPGWDEGLRYGRFSFSKTALLFAETIINEIIINGTDPVYIDEIGPVELEGRGFCEAFEKILKTGRNIYVTIRESCFEDVLRQFEINNYEMIRI